MSNQKSSEIFINNVNSDNDNSTTLSSSLTSEQKKRIEENRLKALSKLLPLKKFQNYAEYDFSKMVDTRGGFLAEEDDDENNSKKKRKIKDPEPELDPYSMYGPNPDEIPHCKECSSIEVDLDFNKVFNVNVCKSCKDKFPEKYSLITKTEAKEVEEYAFKKWGGAEGLDKEFEKRQEEKKKKKDKKFKTKLAAKKLKLFLLLCELKDLRKRTRTDSLNIGKNKPHKHEFGQAVTDSKTGKTTQCCSICGIVIEVDLF
ncbi:8233_t:CDS:2 [Entrophospora sp. SA101]|nr:8233_t:CDS:2 [Entrophospora sp. SA101]CAJ0876455.1 3156_t:CDS:2 [Entrophospora sp. SA101]CAJ0902997.1 1793_t:CDS:2 [Entrophospora sp. SA101]